MTPINQIKSKDVLEKKHFHWTCWDWINVALENNVKHFYKSQNSYVLLPWLLPTLPGILKPDRT